MTTSTYRGQRAVVLGAGRSGVAAAELLAAAGARVRLSDRRDREDLPEVDRLTDTGVKLALGGHPPDLFDQTDLVVVSPGIAPDAAVVQRAEAAGLRIVSELELAAPLLKNPTVAITGSNGKSTVTRMVGDILARAGYETAVCGNIGVPVSRIATAVLRGQGEPERFVLELSSFQTETIDTFHPRWACILNISADHLDRHGDLETYTQAKMRLLARCTSDDWLVYGGDDPALRGRLAGVMPRLVPVSTSPPPPGQGPACWISSDQIIWRPPAGEPVQVVSAAELQVLGRHNLLNAAAAVALGCLAGATPQQAGAALRGFHGLAHRTEPCGTVRGVECINDSKATNVGATIAALEGLSDRQPRIWLILGGRDKDADFTRLRDVVRGRVRRALLIGESAASLVAALAGAVPTTVCHTLERAVETALHAARPGELLLLAPACASFDQYPDFEARGHHFRQLVQAHVPAAQRTGVC